MNWCAGLVIKALCLVILGFVLPFLFILREEKKFRKTCIAICLFSYGIAACRFLDCLWFSDAYLKLFFPRFNLRIHPDSDEVSLLLILFLAAVLLLLIYKLVISSRFRLERYNNQPGRKIAIMFVGIIVSILSICLVFMPEFLWSKHV